MSDPSSPTPLFQHSRSEFLPAWASSHQLSPQAVRSLSVVATYHKSGACITLMMGCTVACMAEQAPMQTCCTC